MKSPQAPSIAPSKAHAMNVRRFFAKTSREALRQVREQLGEDAVILSTQPSGNGVEVLALTPEAMREVEQMQRPTQGIAEVAERAAKVSAGLAEAPAEEDAARMEMSTLSFQDYVRRRMLKRREAALASKDRRETPATVGAPRAAAEPSRASAPAVARNPFDALRQLDVRVDDDEAGALPAQPPMPSAEALYAAASAASHVVARETAATHERAEIREAEREPARQASALSAFAAEEAPGFDAAPLAQVDQVDQRRAAELLAEMRSMKGLIEERFGALAFMEKLQRRPGEARLTQKLLDCGFSPALVRKLAEGLPHDATDEAAWSAQILERNLRTATAEQGIEARGGVYALIGATGVGKTTTTAKIAAAFAARHGAGQLGLITLDAYRVGAQEQLRAYGRILGVPVHTAHDRASLEDLLELLSAKKLVLIDTAGMAQRDARTKELLDMLVHPTIRKVVVVSAAAQGETIDDVLVNYRAAASAGIVLSKIDEAVKLGPALDATIRHRMTVLGVACGQRVPEDWHQLSATSLVQKALRASGSSAWRFDSSDMNLVFSVPQPVAHAAAF